MRTACISLAFKMSSSVEYLFLILKFLAKSSELKPFDDAMPRILQSLFNSLSTGSIVVAAKFPAPSMPRFTFDVLGSRGRLFPSSIFGSPIMSYLKIMDRGFISSSNFSYTDGAFSKATSSDTKSSICICF